jgi:hypothetical protein
MVTRLFICCLHFILIYESKYHTSLAPCASEQLVVGRFVVVIQEEKIRHECSARSNMSGYVRIILPMRGSRRDENETIQEEKLEQGVLQRESKIHEDAATHAGLRGVSHRHTIPTNSSVETFKHSQTSGNFVSLRIICMTHIILFPPPFLHNFTNCYQP